MANDEELHDWGDEDDHTARAGAYVVLVEFVTTERADPEREAGTPEAGKKR